MAKKPQIAICDILNSDLEIEVIFTNPDDIEEIVLGTPAEIAREVGVRTLIYGTCTYRIPAKPSILFDMSEWTGDDDDDL